MLAEDVEKPEERCVVRMWQSGRSLAVIRVPNSQEIVELRKTPSDQDGTRSE